MSSILRHVESGLACCDSAWEAAYRRFETPEQEVAKFRRRYRWMKIERLPRDAKIAEIFCGRGNGLVALSQLGFTNLHGFDLSEDLLLQYQGPAQLHLADCRTLPVPDASLSAVVVQGGLHHLPQLPEDLASVCTEVQRALQPQGHFYIVEPWMTPFLRMVHRITNNRWVRRGWPKADALAVMTLHEHDTYYRWLGMPQEILRVLDASFHTDRRRIAWGKLNWVGHPRDRR